MPRALASREVVHHDFDIPNMGEGFFIEVKKCLTSGELRQLRKFFVRWTLDGKPMPRGNDIEEADVQLILTGVVNWNFEDEQGQTLPITKEVIDGLDERLYQQIKLILQQQYEPLSEEAKNP
jgi:hypothetical protein